jgi:hypothetical protein
MTTITTTQQFSLTLAPKDRRGKPAPVQPGSIVWASSDESIVTVTPDETGLKALVVAQGVGSANVNVSADADLGDGVSTIVGSEGVTVSLGQAVSVGLEVGPIEEQP